MSSLDQLVWRSVKQPFFPPNLDFSRGFLRHNFSSLEPEVLAFSQSIKSEETMLSYPTEIPPILNIAPVFVDYCALIMSCVKSFYT